jgi:hypothetical protein
VAYEPAMRVHLHDEVLPAIQSVANVASCHRPSRGLCAHGIDGDVGAVATYGLLWILNTGPLREETRSITVDYLVD